MEEQLEMIALKIISNSGDAKSMAFQALEAARAGDFEKSGCLMKESEKAATLAHQVQTDMLVEEANGVKHEINLIMIHAQDHLMTSMLACELIKELILLYQDKNRGGK